MMYKSALATYAWLATIAFKVNAQLQIVPGATLTAVNTGQHVQAHGAGIIKVDNLFYMIGEDKTNGSSFQNVNCYSSPNLVEWTYVGALLSRVANGDLGPGRVMERPKVIYNQQTRKYVLYMHIDSSNYKDAKVGVATGDSVCGKYQYRGSYRPMGKQSRDMGLFQDNDGTAYLLSEDREAGLRIFKLAPDHLTVSELMYTWKEKIESPAILRRGNTYFMFGSHLTGWNANDNVYSTSTRMSGPWSGWKEFAPKGSKTFGSQTTYVLPVDDRTAVYMGDRWVEKDLRRSTYVWLPLRLEGNQAILSNREFWDSPFQAGNGSPSGKDISYAAKEAKLRGGAKFLSNNAAGYIGGTGNGAVTFSNIRSQGAHRATLKIYFQNGDRETRYASVVVNDSPAVKIAFLGTEGKTAISVVNISLRAGKNSIDISGLNGGWGPDIMTLRVAEGSSYPMLENQLALNSESV